MLLSLWGYHRNRRNWGCVGNLHPRASSDSSWASGLADPALGSRQSPRRRWPLGSGTARAAPPSPRRSCRGHQPGEVEAPPARSCAPTSSEGVAGGAWDAPSPQSVPELRSLPPRAPAETLGRHGHPELDVTEPGPGPRRRRLLPPRPLPAPSSAMAPRMSGRGGAALLCLSALLAHGKCRGADWGVRMRRAPLGGARRDGRKASPHPPDSQPGVSGYSRVTSSTPSPLAGAEAASPALGTEPGPGKGRGGEGGGTPVLPWVGGRVQTRESGGVSAHEIYGGSKGSARSCPGRPPSHSHPRSRRDPSRFGSAGPGLRPGCAGRCGAAPPGASLPAAVLGKGRGLPGGRGAAAARCPPPAVL